MKIFRAIVVTQAICLILVIGTVYLTPAKPQTPVPSINVTTYYIANDGIAPRFTNGKILIFLNGIFQSPKIDYLVAPDNSILFLYPTKFLVGDEIEEVTLP